MHVSSQEPPVARRWAHKLYLAVVSLILIGIVSEGLLIGPSLFADTRWGRAIHAVLGGLLFLLTLLLPVAGLLARLPSRVTLLSAALCALTLIEVTSAILGRRTPFLAALHPAKALLMCALNMFLIMQGWQMMRERMIEIKQGQGQNPCENG
jgi:hypothetical protein